MFQTIFVSTCTYVRPIVDDLEAIIELEDMAIEQRISIKERLVQFVELHEHFYEYGKTIFLNFNLIWVFSCFSYHLFIRILDKIERILSVPLFLQLPLFGLILAVILYHLEHVN